MQIVNRKKTKKNKYYYFIGVDKANGYFYMPQSRVLQSPECFNFTKYLYNKIYKRVGKKKKKIYKNNNKNIYTQSRK